MKKMIVGSVFLFQLLLANGIIGLAAPPANELNQYLKEIGWTKQELTDYLDSYESSLNDFNSVEELKSFLGTPINSQNLKELLTKYNLTEKGLNDLLNQFGDSLDQYKFIEDLDSSVAFYTNQDDLMGQIKNEIAKFGITENEVNNFFQYLSQVEENNKGQLDSVQALDTRIEKFLATADPSELTDDEVDELAQIVTDTFGLYEIQVKFKLNNKDISVKELLEMQEINGNLYTAIYSKTGELLIDYTIPSEIFQGLAAAWEELLHLGELSNQFVDYLQNGEMYK